MLEANGKPISAAWPELAWESWQDTATTLHMWTQIVGKTRLALTPLQNHWWNVPLYVSARGLTTSAMPWRGGEFEVEFDFCAHVLEMRLSAGVQVERREIELRPRSVADFYAEYRSALRSLGVEAKIWPMPVEVANPIRFDRDQIHQAYDAEFAQRFWRVLLQATRVFTVFRARFRGKVSPVHLFWGALDLACTRFSGRTAPEHPSMPGLADRVTRDAYSHEVSSCGFWPGAPGIEPFFYSYAYPEPAGYSKFRVAPAQALYHPDFGEFVLPYEEMRQSANPDAALLEFLLSTYDAAAECGWWDRPALDVGPLPSDKRTE